MYVAVDSVQQQQQPRVMRRRLYKLGWPCPGWRIAASSPSLFCSLHRVRQPGTPQLLHLPRRWWTQSTRAQSTCI